jgi:Raf kinase inhibitor-like YbhB/YbcL family protein
MQLRNSTVLAVTLVTGIGIGCAACSASSPEEMTLTSAAFGEGESIPTRFSCDGDGVSPPLAWDAVPDGTAAFALLVTDPDAGGFVHWVLSDIPADAGELPEGEGDTIGTPGRSSGGGTGWTGPCPPSGEHRYEFRLYALSEPLGLSEAASADDLRAAVSDLAVGQGMLTAVYAR